MSRTTIHLEVDEDQLHEIDRYREEFKVKTRTSLVDEALGEFFARRKGFRYPRTYGRVTGLKTDTPRRRATDLLEGEAE